MESVSSTSAKRIFGYHSVLLAGLGARGRAAELDCNLRVHDPHGIVIFESLGGSWPQYYW